MAPVELQPSPPDLSRLLNEILVGMKSLQKDNLQLSSAVDAINGRVNMLAGVKSVQDGAASDPTVMNGKSAVTNGEQESPSPKPLDNVSAAREQNNASPGTFEVQPRRTSVSSKIILTSYPGQSGVDPLPMDWGNKDPNLRGPVVVSRHPSTIKRRNGMPSAIR